MAIKKYISLSKLETFLDNLKNTFSNLSHNHTISDITDYTVDSALSSTSTNPVQNKVLDAEFEAVSTAMNVLEQSIDGKADSTHNHDSTYDAKGSADTALNTAKEYTDTKTANLITTSAVDTKISTHDTSTSAHEDIRALITELSTAVNKFLDVDDATTDQLSEVLTLIENNKGTLESLTSSKINVSDIVNNLITNNTSKVLSAAQGVAIKALIDALDAELDTKANSTHAHAISDVTNLQTTLDGKSNTGHTHTVANITDLTATAKELNYMSGVTSNVQTQIDGKANSSHNHSATNITSGTLSSDRLPTVPVDKGGTGATTAAAALTNLGITATANELNIMDGVTATTAELNYMDGVKSNVQAQLNGKQSTITGAATTITTSNLDVSRALVSNASGKVAVSAVTSTELGYLNGVTGNVQTQIDGKANSVHNHAIADVTDLQSTIDTINDNIDTKMDKENPTGAGSLSLNRMADTTIGDYSVAIGRDAIASGSASFSTGRQNTASGDYSHAEGGMTTAEGYYSHAEGMKTKALGWYAHAEGDNTTASGTYSAHAEGSGSTASGNYSHAEGQRTTAFGECSHAEGSNTTASGNYSHAEGMYVTAEGLYSHAEGYNTKVTTDTTATGTLIEDPSTYDVGYAAHAEGLQTVANSVASHAEGCGTTSSGVASHAEGAGTTSSGVASHAEGSGTTASGMCSHAEGYGTTASGVCSHAAGYGTTALDSQYVIGHFSKNGTAASTAGTTGDAFIIGCGTSSSAKNAFRVTYAGRAFATITTIGSGADYAEYFEWEDSNPNNEDRRGYFVTLDGENIKIAKPNDYILGIVSGMPCVVGNGDECWRGRYVEDEFGAFITEEFEYEEKVVNEETGEIEIVTKTGTTFKENPDYDPTLPYIQREDRPEWDAVGMVGVLSVRDDGTCQVNGFCKVAEGGIATASDIGYRVIKRINENIVKVVFK